MSIGLCARTIFFSKQVVGYIFKQACCYVFGLDKILPFGNVNAFPFLSFARIFALSLDNPLVELIWSI